jgi:hypothetical protein
MMGTPVHRLFFVLPLLLDFVSASHVPNMTRVVSHGPVQLIEGLSLAWTILSSAPTGSGTWDNFSFLLSRTAMF